MSFFTAPEKHSIIKSDIVAKYFVAWAKIMSNQSQSDRIAYIDLFCGPGRYEDGTPSTPLKVLAEAAGHRRIRSKLVCIFNDQCQHYADNLQYEIDAASEFRSLRHEPEVLNREVDESLVRELESGPLIPTLLFADPWGYKGLSLRLLASVVSNWGSDCIFFFNYNRINMGISNELVRQLINAVFGTRIANRLRTDVEGLSPDEREYHIVEAMLESLSSEGIEYQLLYRIMDDSGRRTNYHVIFGTKSPIGYKIMKDIMAGMSTDHPGGVASFEFNPAMQDQPQLAGLSARFDELGDILCDRFAGKTMSVRDVFDQHNVGTPYVLRNYKDALIELEELGRIDVSPAADGRQLRKGRVTMADRVRITFPSRRISR